MREEVDMRTSCAGIAPAALDPAGLRRVTGLSPAGVTFVLLVKWSLKGTAATSGIRNPLSAKRKRTRLAEGAVRLKLTRFEGATAPQVDARQST